MLCFDNNKITIVIDYAPPKKLISLLKKQKQIYEDKNKFSKNIIMISFKANADKKSKKHNILSLVKINNKNIETHSCNKEAYNPIYYCGSLISFREERKSEWFSINFDVFCGDIL